MTATTKDAERDEQKRLARERMQRLRAERKATGYAKPLEPVEKLADLDPRGGTDARDCAQYGLPRGGDRRAPQRENWRQDPGPAGSPQGDAGEGRRVMRGLDLESTRTLLDKLQCELRGLSNRTASLVDESPPASATSLATSPRTLLTSRRSSRCCSTGRTPFLPRFPQAKGPSKMTTEITTRNDTYAARYETADPYAQFANEGGPGIQGKLLTCKKGVWGIGPDETPHPQARGTSSSPTL